MSTDASMFIHGKQFRHWELYRKAGGTTANVGGATTSTTTPVQDAINKIVEEMMALNQIEANDKDHAAGSGADSSLYAFKDVNEEDVDMM